MNDAIRKILNIPIKTPIEYWDKYWSYCIEKLRDKDNYEIVLDSPRFLLNNIISEIKYNRLKNKDNSSLFRSQLNEWDVTNIVFSRLFSNEIKQLQQKWDEYFGLTNKPKGPDKNPYLQNILCLCEQINDEINKGDYFNGLLEQLIHTINNAQTLNYDTKKEIHKYTELIISEFVANDFNIEDIQSIQHDIPEIVRKEGGAIVSAPNTYRGLCRENFANEDSYYKAIEDYIDNRSVEERISVLKNYYYIEPKDCFVLFRLEGIKGDTDSTIDDINIYAPNSKKYITETPSLTKIEEIGADRKCLNAAIPIKHKMLHSSIAYAKHRLESILDLFSLSYNTSIPIKYSNKNVSIVNNGICIAGINITFRDEASSSKRQEFIRDMDSLEVSSVENDLAKLDERFTAINQKQTDNTLKLSKAAHWYQKGLYAENSEDRLLFHWIAIESLLKTNVTLEPSPTGNKESNKSPIQIVQRIAAAIMVKGFFRNYCFDAYIDIIYKTQYDNYLDISGNLIEKASLNIKVGDKVYINKFFHHIKEIEENINDEILKTKLHELDSFYMKKDGVKNKEQEISNDIIQIYRLRNLIAHNAIFPHYLINLYANKAQDIGGSIIRFLIEKRRISNQGLDELLVNLVSEYDRFISNIDDEISKLKN
ncbi:MAG: HEPN domain-containing protein [Bacteroidota bacterium]|nr:HEPN domain-containing protein [Bacteroidota bacterium]